MKIEFKWETLQYFQGSNIWDGTERAKVIGGWLVRSQRMEENADNNRVSVSESMIFVPDPNHEWEI